MQEKSKNVSVVKFLTVYGDKISSNEHYNPEDDTTDQRAPVNNPSDLWEQFFMDDDIRAEIEESMIDEKIEDFDDDVYDFEDRSDLGEDIALASQLDLKGSKQRLQAAMQGSSNNKTSNKKDKQEKEKHTEDLDNVISDDDD